MSKFDPLKGLTTEKKKTFNFNPLKGISDEPIIQSEPVKDTGIYSTRKPITQTDTAFPQATWGDGKPVYANPAPVDSRSYVKPEPEKAPYSFMEGIKPLEIKVPQAVTDFMNPLKVDYQKRDEAIRAASERQKEMMKPLEDLIRKPLEATFGTAMNIGEAIPEKGREAALAVLNHPAVAPKLVELSKRTSGTGVYSMVKAIGPKTFDEAYQSARAYQAGDPSKLNQFLYQLGDTIPQTAIGVALNFVPIAGQPLSYGYWTALSAAEQIQNKGAVTSLGNIGIDVIGDKMLGSSIQALFKAPAKTLVQTMVQNFGVEGGTEVAQDLGKMFNDYRNAKTPEEKAKIMGEIKNYFTSGQILMTAGVGGLTGAGIGTAAYTVNQTLPQTTVTSEERGTPVFRGGPIDTENVPNQGISVSTDRTTAENFISPDGGAVSEAYISSTANILKESSIPSNLQTEYITVAKELANPNNFSAQLQSVVRQKQQAIVDYAKQNGFDAVEIPFENEIRVLNPKILTKTISNNEQAQGPGYQNFANSFDTMVKNGTLFPEDSTILKTIFQNTNDDFLKSYTLSENARFGVGSKYGETFGRHNRVNRTIQIQKGLATKDKAIASRVVLHEFGHAGYYNILSADERAVVDNVYKTMPKKETRLFFSEGTGANPDYHASEPAEFFAESFSEYVLANKVPAKQMEPLLKRVARIFFEGMKKLVNRKEYTSVNRLAPVYEKILAGEKATPLAEFAKNEPPSFKTELQKILNQPKTKEVPAQSIFPSMAVQDGKIEPTPTMTPDEVSAAPSVQEVPFDLPPDAPEPVNSAHKRTPDSQKITWFDSLSTPLYPFERMGLRANYQQLKGALLDIHKEKVIIHDKLANWMKQVPGNESSRRIFGFLDGESIQLNQQEAKVAGEIRPWLDQWADRMGIPKEERISNYITHIFPKEADAGIPEEIAAMIRNKMPGEVYNPFLLERLGAEGYIKDVWKALDAYSKRAVRKVHLDPALASLKELVGPGKQVSEDSQIQYVQDIINALNMRPTSKDVITDNTIKKIFGNTFGSRPTRNITLFFRKLIYGSKIGASITTFSKNLTQVVNTYSELGEQYTAIGYIDLTRNGGKELRDNGVLLNSMVEDQTYSALKKYAEMYDQALFLNMNASEFVNRGAAYYGAKAKFLAGKVNPKDFKKAFGTEKPQNHKPTVEEAVAYGKFIAEKTQFTFGPMDNPSLLSSDVMKTTFQLASFDIKQQEFVVRKFLDKEWAKLARYFLSSFLLYGLVGQVFGMGFKDVFPYIKFGPPPILQFIWNDLFKIGILGRDKYGNYLDAGERGKRIGKSLFTNVMPGGAQIKRTYEGIKLVNEGGQKNDRGYYDYKVAQTPMNYVRASLWGPQNLSETKDFYKEKDEKKKDSSKSKSKGKFDPLKGM